MSAPALAYPGAIPNSSRRALQARVALAVARASFFDVPAYKLRRRAKERLVFQQEVHAEIVRADAAVRQSLKLGGYE
jgi:hypothetical protein